MKKEFSVLKILLLSGMITLSLTACSSGGKDAPDNSTDKPVAITNLGFSPDSIKTFRFQWEDVSNTTHYKLMEDPDGASGFTQVGTDIPQGTETVDHIVPLYARINAEYLLQSCNTSGCSDSETESIADFIGRGGSIGQAAGKFEPNNPEPEINFGISSLSADGRTLAISAVGDDDEDGTGSGAVYVFTRNGSSWEQQAYLKNSNILGFGLFGYSISLSSNGDTLAVGSLFANIVSLYTRSGESWTLQQELTPSIIDDDDFFGRSVSLSADGNTLAIGASGETSLDAANPNDNSGSPADIDNFVAVGAAYIFTRNEADWSQIAYIKPEVPQDGEGFGQVSISGDGNTLAVGAFLHDLIGNPDNIDNIGVVYTFTRDAAEWSQQAKIQMDTPSANSRFGSAVSLSNDGSFMAVGTPGETNDSGAVYLLTRSAETWISTNRLVATFRDEGDLFGLSLSLAPDGNVLAIGSPFEDGNGSDINRNQDNNALTDSGAVFVYNRSDDWTEATYIKVNTSEENDNAGGSVSLAADGTLAVGIIARDDFAGTAYLY